jgi:hypothetical protein
MERLKEINMNDVECSTVDSYFINSTKKYNIIYIDEGLMLQPGEIDLLIHMTGAMKVYIYGDRKQLNFIPRVAGYESKIMDFIDFTKYEFRNLSRRCPRDVASMFAKSYNCDFYTTNKVNRSMYVKSINGINSVPKEKAKYLVFTQNEKKELLKYGFDVNTIHEVQGMTFESVILVRLSAKQMTIYDSVQHILVALTRHTKNFLYCTTRLIKDAIVDKINAVIINTKIGDENMARKQIESEKKTRNL